MDQAVLSRIAAALAVVAVSFAWSAQGQPAGPGESAKAAAPPPEWLYPGDPGGVVPPPANPAEVRHVPNSALSFTSGQVADRFGAVDWHPETHGPMPKSVANGEKPAAWACAFCHLANGQGRPENMSLAGLSEAYVLRTLEDLKSGARQSADPTATARMAAIARASSAADLAEAAAYYRAITYKKWIDVRESETAPNYRMTARFMLPQPGTQALGDRIVEVPIDVARTTLHDDASGFIAYVPPGSVAQGKALAAGGAGRLGCGVCHGAALQGTAAAPPLAGRSPTSMLRQLYDFKVGARGGDSAKAMKAVVEPLRLKDMIALAAYAASLDPQAGAVAKK